MNISQKAYIADDADLIGDITIGDESSVWFKSVIRADRSSVIIGHSSNVQDLCIIHMDYELPVVIGDNVTIGHGAIVHGATIGDNTLVGMRATIMNGCKIGKNCIIGAGALLTKNMIVPDNSLVMGMPAKIVRKVTEDEIASNIQNAKNYVNDAIRILKMYTS